MISVITYGPQQAMLDWAAQRMDYPDYRFRDDAQAIGHMLHGRPAAVVVFDTWSPTTCMIHVASDGSRRWFTRSFCQAVMAYPFIQCDMRRLTALIREGNTASRDTCEGLGFVEEGRMRAAGPAGDDVIVLGLLREECRWIEGRKPAIVRPEQRRTRSQP